MIPLPKLIAYWSGRLQPHPPITNLDWHDVCQATLTYLNGYRTTNAMLRSLAEDTSDLDLGGD